MNNSSKEDYLKYKKLDIKKVSADYYQRNKEEINIKVKIYRQQKKLEKLEKERL